jgi:hypothetical protein
MTLSNVTEEAERETFSVRLAAGEALKRAESDLKALHDEYDKLESEAAALPAAAERAVKP